VQDHHPFTFRFTTVSNGCKLITHSRSNSATVIRNRLDSRLSIIPNGGTGGTGGNAARKRKRTSESQEEKEARCKARNEKEAGSSKKPARMIAENKRKRENHKNATSAQVTTHMLLAVLFKTLAFAAMLAEQKMEVDTFLIAVHHASTIAADQGKVMAVQIQFARPGRQAIKAECRGTVWPGILSAFGQECGLREVCHVTFTNLRSFSASHAHQLETHAQRTMINLTSRERDGAINQFYCAGAVSAMGMSKLSLRHLVDGIPRVLVITITMWTKNMTKKNDKVELPAPRALKSRTDAVFGIHPTTVSLHACECNRGCDDELTCWCACVSLHRIRPLSQLQHLSRRLKTSSQ